MNIFIRVNSTFDLWKFVSKNSFSKFSLYYTINDININYKKFISQFSQRHLDLYLWLPGARMVKQGSVLSQEEKPFFFE